MVYGKLAFRRESVPRQKCLQYSTICSNAGFLGNPIAEGIYGAEGLVLAAGDQTGGRGRMGRRFFSPAGSGIYMSLLLRPGRSAAESALLTPAAAVAAAESIEAVSGLPAEIKWVNDVLVAGRKVCGILTEASVDGSSGAAEHVVIGIGVNALPPPGGFPGELRDTAGAVFPDSRPADLRCRLAAAILDRLMELYAEPDSAACHEAYKSRSAVLGKEVRLLSPGRDPVPALVLDIDRDYALRVRLADGTEKRILSGEVSLRTT